MKDRIAKIISECIGTYRGAKSKFAKDLGARTSNVSDWLSGKSSPGVEYHNKICDTYHISRNWLSSGRGEMLETTSNMFAEVNLQEALNSPLIMTKQYTVEDIIILREKLAVANAIALTMKDQNKRLLDILSNSEIKKPTQQEEDTIGSDRQNAVHEIAKSDHG